ncbi:MAG TPA: lysylphosphatidylglycerol synthase domain-containing protein [Tepidiformaceae bacterium]|nr:lysylphosphatidylglycerol synthase domain-containing protein [Tepidiformaceae bacterium]
MTRISRRVVMPAIHVAVAAGVVIAAVPAIAFLRSDHPSWAVAPLGVALVIFAVQVGALAAGWGLLLARANGGTRPGARLVLRSFLLGWLVRYLPGPPTGPAGKYVACRAAGWPLGPTAAALFYENLLQLGAGLLLPALTIGFVLGAKGAWVSPLAVAVAVVITMAAVSPPVVRRLRRIAGRVGIGSATEVAVLPFRLLVGPGATFFLGAVLAALAFHVVAVTVSDLPASDVGRSLFVFGLASAVGFVVPFAPSGAGVREGVIVATLGPTIGGPEALSVAIVARATAITFDALLATTFGAGYVLLALMRRFRRSRPKFATHPVNIRA